MQLRPRLDIESVYLYSKPVDMRKAANGLSVLVESEMGKCPFKNGMFVFCNRGRSIIKILVWERNGFVLWQKRLEKDCFFWPKSIDQVNGQQLNFLLDGLDISRMEPHKSIVYETVL